MLIDKCKYGLLLLDFVKWWEP